MYGGRCDFALKKNNYQQILNDLWVLWLEELKWYEVEQTGQIPRERFSHSAAIIGTQMVIFGGVNDENFCASDLFALELEPFNQGKFGGADSRRNPKIQVDKDDEGNTHRNAKKKKNKD